jgi:transcriptional regulator MraZ
VEKSGKSGRPQRDGFLFLGTHAHTLDGKGRVSLPVRFREALGDGRLILTTNVDSHGRCLVAYPASSWARFLARVADLPQFDEDVLLLKRLYVAGASECAIDALGRILVPPTLREHAELSREVIWAGMGRQIELWDKDRWTALRGDGSLAQRLAKLGL